MSDTVTITVVGNIGAEPTLRATREGRSILSFGVATAQRRQDKATGEWVDGETSWYSVSVFGELADHAAASLHKGQRVIVTGRLQLRKWETQTKEGWSADLYADALGHDLRWGTSTFRREPRQELEETTSQDRWVTATPGGEAAPEWVAPGQSVGEDASADAAPASGDPVEVGARSDETPF